MKGFDRLGFTEIDAWTLPINLASRRVMEKLGYTYSHEFTFAGLPHSYYRLAGADRSGKARGSLPPH